MLWHIPWEHTNLSTSSLYSSFVSKEGNLLFIIKSNKGHIWCFERSKRVNGTSLVWQNRHDILTFAGINETVRNIKFAPLFVGFHHLTKMYQLQLEQWQQVHLWAQYQPTKANHFVIWKVSSHLKFKIYYLKLGSIAKGTQHILPCKK